MTGRRAEIRARLWAGTAAAPLPWSSESHVPARARKDAVCVRDAGGWVVASLSSGAAAEAVADLIAHAPADLSWLLGLVDWYEAALANYSVTHFVTTSSTPHEVTDAK